MEEKNITLVIDMMGGDQGLQMTKDAVWAFHAKYPLANLILVGEAGSLNDMDAFEVVSSRGVMKMDAGALDVLRNKESSMAKALTICQERKADGVISAGGTGAFLSAATLILKKIPGVKRPALITSFPNFKTKRNVTILDVGASNENTPEEIAQFAVMGSIYSSIIDKIDNPVVKLLANGTEENKGSPQGKEAFKLLRNDKNVNFQGNIEASQVLASDTDVVVTDGYSGNILLKSTEGAAKQIGSLIKAIFKKNWISKLSYLGVRKGIKGFKDTLDPRKVGGAMLIGVNGVVVKAHGNSDSEAFFHAIEVAYSLASKELVKKISDALEGSLDGEH